MNSLLKIGGVIMFILFMFVWLRQPIAAFKPWIDWFDTYDAKKKYRCIQPNLFAYYYGPSFMYKIAYLVSSSKLEHTWHLDFIMSIMRRYARTPTSGKSSILVPRNLCSSLVPDKDDPVAASSMIENLKIPKGHTVAWGDSTLTSEHDMRKIWPTTINDWQVLMCSDVSVGGWGCNFAGGGSDGVWDPAGTLDDSWESPTNFLFHFYAIPSNSKLIIGFVTSQPIWNHQILYPGAMYPLLGIHMLSDIGGWYGLVSLGGAWGGFNSLEIQSYIWAHALSSSNNSETEPCSHPAGYVTTGLSLGLSVMPIFVSFLDPPLAILASLTMACAGTGLGAVAQGCNN
jgi:hypothetical protein